MSRTPPEGRRDPRAVGWPDTAFAFRASSPGKQNGSADISRHRAAWMLAGVLLLAAAWRFWRLGAESLWIDEAASWHFSRFPLLWLFTYNVDHGNPPLYYALLREWMALFGTTEAAGRGLSAAMGVGSVGILYLLGRDLFDRRVGLAASLLMALSPLHRWYSQEARAYLPALFFGLLSAWLFARALHTDRRRDWLGAALCAALAFYTHYTGLLIPAFEGVYALAAARRPRALAAAAVLVALCAPGVLLFLAPTFLHAQGYAYWQGYFGPGALLKMADRLYGVPVSPGDPILWKGAGAVLLLAAVLLPAIQGARGLRCEETRRPMLFVLLYGAVPFALFTGAACLRPVWHDRYLLVALPAFFLLLGASLVRMKGWPRALLAGCVLLLYAASIARPSPVWAKEDWRHAVAAVEQASAGVPAEQGEVLITYPYVIIGFDWYYHGALPRVGFPLRGVALEAQARAACGKRAVFVIHEDHHDGDAELALVRRLLTQYGSGSYRRFTGIRVFAFGEVAARLGGVPITPQVLATARSPYR